MKKSNDELLNAFKAFMGDSPSDEHISFLEDLNDSLTNDNSDEINAINTKYNELESRYNDLKNKYISRFGEPGSTVDSGSTIDDVGNPGTPTEDDTDEPLSVEELSELF